MRILIADDHGIVREGLKSLIEHQSDMKVIAEAEDGRAAVELAKELCPDVVVMDISMPTLNGIEATRLILQENKNIKVIALSMHSDKHIVMEALEAGASAYILKSYLFDELIRALESVSQDRCYLSPRITNVVVDDYVQKTKRIESGAKPKLTSRERQVLQLIAEGKTIKEIARILHISPKTADANRRQIMNKLNMSSVAELTKYAVREGLTSLEF
ncbi:MAG: response regulator transcription factor [Planctomycetes bacterium]|nr:response regulator transcription factor [Planctomycetota bacterium]MBL7143953.1 response regulator transcription factor [Phycisphaerae bacterium]